MAWAGHGGITGVTVNISMVCIMMCGLGWEVLQCNANECS